jgi:hypothetical protein
MKRRYPSTADLTARIPVFPLSGALLLPRTELPLQIFEPRYLAMVNDALAGDRLIGMIQPEGDSGEGLVPDGASLHRVGCVGRITAFSETPDERLMVTLSGICRFRMAGELSVATPYRQIEADYAPFAADLTPDAGVAGVDRSHLLKTFRAFLEAHDMSADWREVDGASTEALVNTLSLLAPYGPRDKQALLEAPDLAARAEVLVALTEMSLARNRGDGPPSLQ